MMTADIRLLRHPSHERQGQMSARKGGIEEKEEENRKRNCVEEDIKQKKGTTRQVKATLGQRHPARKARPPHGTPT